MNRIERPTELISPEEALKTVLRHTPAPSTTSMPLCEAYGCVLAKSVHADRHYPPFHRAMMDGFGVRISDHGKTVRVIAEVAAGRPWQGNIEPGEAVEIMTGAPCPAGVEAVVPVEETRRMGNEVHLPESIRPGRHVSREGSDCEAGMELFRAGTTITPLVAATLAALGMTRPTVYQRPRVTVIATGDELVEPKQTPEWFQLRDSNGPMLRTLLKAVGTEEVALWRVGDDQTSIRDAIARAAKADLILLTGGVSVGRYDHVPECAMAEGWNSVFHKVAQKPGKPLFFATLDQKLLFGMPGNPLAVHLCAHRYVAPVIRRMTGRRAIPKSFTGTLTETVQYTGSRASFCLARANQGGQGWLVRPLIGRSSADLFSLATADAMIQLQPGRVYAAGESISFEWLTGSVRP